jgi:hypothetical protein
MATTPSDAQPTEYNLVITRGETYVRPFLWQTGTPAAPVDLTSYTARMQIRPAWLVPGETPAAALISLTDTSGIALGGAAGTVTVTITDVLTSALTIDDGVYDLELIAPVSGKVTKFLRGTVTVLPEATV